MRIDPFMRSFSPQEKTRLIAELTFLDLKGPVKVVCSLSFLDRFIASSSSCACRLQLSSPDVQLCVLLDYAGIAPAEDPSAERVSPPVPSYLARHAASGGMREVCAQRTLFHLCLPE